MSTNVIDIYFSLLGRRFNFMEKRTKGCVCERRIKGVLVGVHGPGVCVIKKEKRKRRLNELNHLLI